MMVKPIWVVVIILYINGNLLRNDLVFNQNSELASKAIAEQLIEKAKQLP